MIKVSGLGIEAAALDLESRVAGHDPSAADRADARALVEILYYGLTGRWPGKRPGIPSAPRLGGVPVKPSTLVPGVDPVLDELCERTWSSQPPVSAAEVARSLGSWDQVVGYRESSSTPMPTAQRPSSAAGSAGSGSAGANAGATVAAVSAAGAGVANAARGVLDRLRRSGAGKGATVAPSRGAVGAPIGHRPTQPGQAPAAPAPTEQSATTEEAAARLRLRASPHQFRSLRLRRPTSRSPARRTRSRTSCRPPPRPSPGPRRFRPSPSPAASRPSRTMTRRRRRSIPRSLVRRSAPPAPSW